MKLEGLSKMIDDKIPMICSYINMFKYTFKIYKITIRHK